jgi:acyl-CoA dehydrogenase
MFDTTEIESLRAEVRAFIDAKLPADIRDTVRAGRELKKEQHVRWQRLLAERGWLVGHWPGEFGGLGWGAAERNAFDEETCTRFCPELNAITFDMIGPVLIRFGTPTQQARFLAPIRCSEHWWCQGYSEPNAGSDLASLATRAERRGDRYVVNGQKIWTSYAHYADWMFCLVRTDPTVKQQEGISFLLIDMKSPGVTVRPILGIHGWRIFNEVFLENVEVPRENLVGRENQGWSIAKSLLEFERLRLARIGENKRRMARARAVGESVCEAGEPLVRRPWFRARFAELDVRLLALEANAARFLERARAGETIGPEVSQLKLRGSELIQLWEQLTVDALGPDALPFAPPSDADADSAPVAGAPAEPFADAIAATASARRFLSRGYTIAGGSSEIQRNILAKQVLGL